MMIIKLLLHVLFFFFINSLLDQVLGHDHEEYQVLNTNSTWLKNHTGSNWRRPKPPRPPRPPRPEICRPIECRRSGQPMARMRCCRQQCVDVLSDPNHCRFCFRSCRFALACCDGECSDTNTDPSNCGQCGNKCDSGAPCEFGMCGYAAPSSQPGKRRKRRKQKPGAPPSPDTEGSGKVYDDRDDE